MDQWLVALVATQFAFVLGLFWIIVHYRSRRQQQRSEERSKLLGQFGDAEALNQFLEGDAGSRFLELTAGKVPSSRTAFVWVCFFGLVSLVGGLAVLLMATLGVLDGGQGFFVLGGLLLAGGIGILIGTVVAFQLLKSSN